MDLGGKAMTMAVIVFFHAQITVENENIFFRAREMPINNMIQPIHPTINGRKL